MGLEEIFKHQKSLMIKYHSIEKHSGLMQTGLVPVDINSQRGQARLKDFAWRVTEELTEAMTATSHSDIEEELIDCLHFMVELLILSDIGPLDLLNYCEERINNITDVYHKPIDLLTLYEVLSGANNSNNSETLFYEIVMNLGISMNCLKNRPWKTTYTATNVKIYRSRLLMSFEGLMTLIYRGTSMNAQDIYNTYIKKNQKNQLRMAE